MIYKDRPVLYISGTEDDDKRRRRRRRPLSGNATRRTWPWNQGKRKVVTQKRPHAWHGLHVLIGRVFQACAGPSLAVHALTHGYTSRPQTPLGKMHPPSPPHLFETHSLLQVELGLSSHYCHPSFFQTFRCLQETRKEGPHDTRPKREPKDAMYAFECA